MSVYQSEIRQLHEGGVLHVHLQQNGERLSWSDVAERWRDDRLFREFFISVLTEAPYRAYFWETPPVTIATLDREFEFVLVESRQLAGIRADQAAFANRFARAEAGATVLEFPNLGGDATLVVPCPCGPLPAYAHLRDFAHHARQDQQDMLWQRVGAALQRRLGTQPVWVSTCGLGVYWLHVRLDSTPKYYRYRPYRAPPH
jgi:hypothetical protein